MMLRTIPEMASTMAATITDAMRRFGSMTPDNAAPALVATSQVTLSGVIQWNDVGSRIPAMATLRNLAIGIVTTAGHTWPAFAHVTRAATRVSKV